MYNIKTIEILLKNELSSTEIYQNVLVNLQNNNANAKESGFLLSIFNGHKNAISSLQHHIHDLGGTFTKNLDVADIQEKPSQNQAKNRLTIKSALKVLMKVEKNMTENYEYALENSALPLAIQCLIQWKLLLIQYSHTRTLDRLLDNVTA